MYTFKDTTVIDTQELTNILFFRQSMLNDYMTCPQMAFYRWVMGLEQQQSQFLSAFLGTAGHAVIEYMHDTAATPGNAGSSGSGSGTSGSRRLGKLTWLELLDAFETEFWKAINASPVPPTLPTTANSVQEAFAQKSEDYIQMLDGYQYDPLNHKFFSLMAEQKWVLEVASESGSHNYLFTGTLDQAGVKEDGNFKINDIKFRENTFKPNKVALNLDTQLTLYALACVKGNPACEACRPRYEGGENAFDALGSSHKKIVYHGPCADCQAKIATKRWPRKYASPCTLIWMRDYFRHEKDQHEKMIPNPTAPKIKGGKRGTSWVRPQMLNPKWGDGYKKGDYVGRRHYDTYRDPALLDTLMRDILKICDAMRRGEFYRRPGAQCAFWCKFRDPCQADIKMEVNDRFMEEASAFASDSLD